MFVSGYVINHLFFCLLFISAHCEMPLILRYERQTTHPMDNCIWERGLRFFKKQIGAFKRHPNRCKILMENSIYIYGTKIICNLNINLKININKYTKKKFSKSKKHITQQYSTSLLKFCGLISLTLAKRFSSYFIWKNNQFQIDWN